MNQLIHATSPYLLQHAHNPVDWYPYSAEALDKAKKEDKLMLISIGYAACHWCHVMEKECFEDAEVAKLMNAHFVCIKVDREERPDVDKIYMDAVVVMTQQGGWPLNCICLPDGRPLYGGTYFPKANWLQVLERVANVFAQRKDYAFDYAEKLTNAMQEMSKVVKNEKELSFVQEDVSNIVSEILQNTDKEWGGVNTERNKFPLPCNQKFLLHATFYAKKYNFPAQLIAQSSINLHNTLNRMAWGGIFDQIGGGFSRYSTDKYWQVPHFEKMLYDNAQMISLYAEAYHSFPNPLYKNIVNQTINFVKTELSAENGGFYASLDADSEGVEGKFYVWSYEEILAAFKNSKWAHLTASFCEYYRITAEGNWEGTNVIWSTESLDIYARDTNSLEFLTEAENMRKHLYEIRSKRVRPALDDKILTSWNALMIKGLVEAAQVFDEKEWLVLAEKNAEFIWQNLTGAVPRGISKDTPIPIRLFRNFKNGQKTIPAFLDDYAYLIAACLALFSANFQAIWLQRALHLWYYVEANFYDETTGMFFYTEGDASEIVRKYDTSDDVTPASCSSLAHSLFILHQITGKSKYDNMVRQMLQNVADDIMHKTYWSANWAMLMLKYVFPQQEIVVTGKKAQDFLAEIQQTFAPDSLYFGATDKNDIALFEGRFHPEKTQIFVCHGQTCEQTVENVADMKKN